MEKIKLKLMVRFIILLSTFFVLGCNSGGNSSYIPNKPSEDFIPPSESVPTIETIPYGLNNLGNSCYMNAALQIILNHKRLTQEVITQNPMAQFNEFILAYQNGAQHKINQYHINIANYIYSLPNAALKGAIGSPLDVLQGDGYTSHGLNVSLQIIDDSMLITNYLSNNNYVFSFLISNRYITVSYNDLPSKERINGFIYNTAGHYVAYVRKNNIWYLINDSMVSIINPADLKSINRTITTGIEVVSYDN